MRIGPITASAPIGCSSGPYDTAITELDASAERRGRLTGDAALRERDGEPTVFTTGRIPAGEVWPGQTWTVTASSGDDSASATVEVPDPPGGNVILVIIDDVGTEKLGVYGATDAAPTPNIDALAKRYAEKPPADRGPLDKAFAGAMRDEMKSGTVDYVLTRPVARAAFLLVWVEGFPRPVAARILDVGDGEFSALLNAANASISKLLATDVLIIEDELLIAFELEGVLKKLGHRVTSIARTHRMAVKQAQLQPPKLILADINLADGSSGMKAANEILTTTVAPVIFITAYPERLLTGGCPEPTFVITKPFRAEEIQAVVGQALFFDLKAQSGISADTCPSELISSCFPKSLRS